MKTTFALFRRELGVYFVSPMAYIILTCMMIIFGMFFKKGAEFAIQMNAPFVYSEVLASIAGLMVFVAPLITMRLIAEEKNKGTFETLMTAPVTELQVVLGKYAATVAFTIFLLLPTLAHAILVSKYGTLDVTEVIAGYIGLILTTASLLAIGVFVSSVCSSQVTAGVVTFAVIFMLLMSAMHAQSISDATSLGRAAKAVVEMLNPYRNMGDFTRGIIDTRPIVYLVSLIVFFLFLSVRALESPEVAMNLTGKRRLLIWLNVSVMTLLMAAFLVGVNLFAHSRFARIDMTTDKVWAISAQSRTILKSIPRDLQIFVNAVSDERVQDKSLPEAWRRTLNLLSEMANQNPKIKVSPIFEGTQAQSAVIAQFSAPQPNMIYFIYKTVDDKPLSRAITITDLYQGNPQTGDIIDYIGESRIITTIAQLVSDRKAVVYLTSGHREIPPSMAERRGWSALQGRLTALENTEFKPLILDRDKAVPDEADLVMILAPETDFTTVETDALKKYWNRGGRLFVAMHPLFPDKQTEFRAFLESIGVRANRDIVIDAQRELGDPGMLVIREYGAHPVNQGMHGLPFRVALTCSVQPAAVTKRMQTMALMLSSKATWAETDLPPNSKSRQTPGEPWGPIPVSVASEEITAGGKPARIIAYGGVAALTNEFNMVQDTPNDFTLGYFLNNIRWLMERDVLMAAPESSRKPRMKPFSPPPGADAIIGWISLAGIPFLGIALGGLAWYFRRK